LAAKDKSKRIPWRLVLAVAALGLVSVAAVYWAVAAVANRVRRYALTDAAFFLSPDRQDALTVEGHRYASRGKISRIFAPDFDRSIFAAPLAERRRELLAVDWVEDATVSRVWPNQLSVRIRERNPVAFVSFPTGVLLIDSHGVLLDPPAQAQFAFPVLSGVRESDSLAERRGTVRTFLRVQDDMGYLMKDISEVDAGDPESIRVVAQVGNRAMELLLGDTNFAGRYQNFLNHYPEIQRHSPDAKLFDLRLEDRITAKE
jgi:cell division protein FtsQ